MLSKLLSTLGFRRKPETVSEFVTVGSFSEADFSAITKAVDEALAQEDAAREPELFLVVKPKAIDAETGEEMELMTITQLMKRMKVTQVDSAMRLAARKGWAVVYHNGQGKFAVPKSYVHWRDGAQKLGRRHRTKTYPAQASRIVGPAIGADLFTNSTQH